MKTYEDYSQSPDGWNVSSTLELTDDGRFSYSEGWTDYTNASLSGGAGGTWRRGDGVIIFRAERVYTPMYFPWAVGRELTGTVRGDALEFAHNWTLRLKTIPIKEIPVRNDDTKPKTLVLEPWGIRRTLAPGERVRIVTQGEFWYGVAEKRVEYGDDEIVYKGWAGTWATVIPEPSPPQPAPAPEPPAPPRAPRAEAPKPRTGQHEMSPVKPTVRPPAPRFVPRAPSPELAALLRRWVDEQGDGNMIARLCKENDAIPLDGNQLEIWALRTDGQVLCIDHESFAQRAEPEEDSEVAYGSIEVGAEKHPELLELLPPDRGRPS